MTRDQPLGGDAPEWLSVVVDVALSGDGVTTWVPSGSFAESALVRVPRVPEAIPDTGEGPLELDVVPGGTRSAQLAVASTEPLSNLCAAVSSFESPDGDTIDADAVDVRHVGYVPVEHSLAEFEGPGFGDEIFGGVAEIAPDGSVSGHGNPDVVADPLLDRTAIDVPAYRAQPLWFSFRPPADAPPGEYSGAVTIRADECDPTTVDVTLTVRDVPTPDLRDGRFHLDVWLHPDAVAAEHGVEPWSDDHWRLLEPYLDDLAAVGQQTIPASIVHHPWAMPWLGGEWRPQTEAGYESLVEWRYDGEWHFDFEQFDRFVRTALERGVGPTISAYSMLAFRTPQRLSYYDADGEFVVEEVEAGSDRWEAAWAAFLRAFSSHLADHGWLDQTYLSFDERPPEQMEHALSLVDDVAPEFNGRIQISGSDEVEPIADDLSVLYRHLPLDDEVIESRRRDGKTTTFYVCVTPDHPNTFTFSPAVEARMLPWIAAGNDLDGFLRWAYNSWPSDPLENPVFRFTQGDEYLVYPGDDGPVSSIRWELLREGIEEYELVAELRESGGAVTADRALDLATSEPDAREKDVGDLVRARQMVLDALEERRGE